MVNSVFLYYCTKAGLDLAIVNAEKLERFASIPEEERRLAENLLFNTPPADATIESLAHRARGLARADRASRKPASTSSTSPRSPSISARPEEARKQAAEDLPLDQRLANYIIEGTKDGLIADLDRKRAEGAAPLDIINGPLMAGMTEVGRLFNNNELIVAEVLQSAEAMKAAVNHLEQFMEKADTADARQDRARHGQGRRARHRQEPGRDHSRQQRLRGDQPRHQGAARGADPGLARASARRHRPLRPAGEERAADGDHGAGFQGHGVAVPLLVGGAALSEKFTHHAHRPGLRRADLLRQGRDDRAAHHESADGSGAARRRARSHTYSRRPSQRLPEAAPVAPAGDARSPKVRTDIPIPAAPYLDRRVRDVPQPAEVWSYINPFMLYGRHLGYKGNFEKLLAERDPKALKLLQRRGGGEARSRATS